MKKIKGFVKMFIPTREELRSKGLQYITSKDAGYAYYAEDGKVYVLESDLLLSILGGSGGMASVLRNYDVINDSWCIGDAIKDIDENGNISFRDDVVLCIDDENNVIIKNHRVIRDLLQNQPTADYVSLATWADLYNKSVEAAKYQCQHGRVKGAMKIGGTWIVPWYTPYPTHKGSTEYVVNNAKGCTLEGYDYLASIVEGTISSWGFEVLTDNNGSNKCVIDISNFGNFNLEYKELARVGLFPQMLYDFFSIAYMLDYEMVVFDVSDIKDKNTVYHEHRFNTKAAYVYATERNTVNTDNMTYAQMNELYMTDERLREIYDSVYPNLSNEEYTQKILSSKW